MARQTHTLRTIVALVIATASIFPAAAAARFDQNPVYFHQPRAAVRVVRVTDGGGFDWGDAAIGAAAGLGLALLGLAGGRVVVARRRRRTSASPAIG